MKLDGLHAVVTGAGSGLGRAIAAGFAREGALLTLLDRRMEGLEETRASLDPAPSGPVCAAIDVTQTFEVDREIRCAANVHGAVRIVVNCAGIILRKDFLHTSDEEWRQVLDVNVIGYANVLRATIPRMTKGGSIIQIASSNAHRGGHGYASYAASKGAVLAMTRHLAVEMAPLGIRVNSLSPGPTLTALNRDVFSKPRAMASVAGAIPLGRLGRAVDVVGAAIFLAAPDSDYITGTDLPVDGGFISQARPVEEDADFYRKPS